MEVRAAGAISSLTVGISSLPRLSSSKLETSRESTALKKKLSHSEKNGGRLSVLAGVI